MSISNVSSNSYTAAQIQAAAQSKDAQKTAAANPSSTKDTGVIYESSATASESKPASRRSGKVDEQTIAKLKSDADARLSQLKGIVEQLITKQGKAVSDAGIWSQFRQGIEDGSITVDAATAKQAAEDISEDGYWGVKQTSERILDFAKALTGGDSSKAEQMRDAVKKGFEAAAKVWGDQLPDISQKTYDAVMKGIDDWKNESTSATEA